LLGKDVPTVENSESSESDDSDSDELVDNEDIDDSEFSDSSESGESSDNSDDESETGLKQEKAGDNSGFRFDNDDDDDELFKVKPNVDIDDILAKKGIDVSIEFGHTVKVIFSDRLLGYFL
jgi:hypothetical protein